MRAFWLAAFTWVACTGGPQEPPALVWPLRDFFNKPKATFSGFPTAHVAVFDGGIPWRTADYENPPAVADTTKQLVVRPAFQNGNVAAYVITEIWDTHPDPWIQPVYHVLRADGSVSDFVVGVGVDSTFYSPYWRLYNAADTAGAGPYESVADIVNAKLPQNKGPLVVCPIVPDDYDGFAREIGQEPVRPLSFQSVAQPKTAKGYADGVPSTYLDFGPDHQVGQLYEEGADGVVLPGDFYVFAVGLPDGGRAPIELPAVLDDEASQHSYVRRIDVLLAGEAVFVPKDNDAMRNTVKKVVGSFAIVPDDVDAQIPKQVGLDYAMRVAKDGSCFADHTQFPQGCTWLDSEIAITQAVPQSRIISTSVTLTATAVLLGKKTP